MTLIRSISGIRGTIGGSPGEGLTPQDIVMYTSAWGSWLMRQERKKRYRAVIGRDARISGEMVNHLVCGTLMGMGIDVTDLGPATTPTVEMAVKFEEADGGIILTASHNPAHWNALKLLNNRGEFLSAADGELLLEIASSGSFNYAEVYELGNYRVETGYTRRHIEEILNLPLVDREAIRAGNFKVAVDCINSVGGTAVPQLLETLGVKEIIKLHCEPDGNFAHNPEPLPANLIELSEKVVAAKADLGFAVDPDVDRLAIVNEDGTMFGEEYTLVAVADYVLQNTPGNTVSNLSSTMALKDITGKHGGVYSASAVGEVNVVEEMKRTRAVIGGEGNGGVIYPPLHYGRDALAGIALFLSHLARSGSSCSELRKLYPDYHLVKNRIELSENIDTGKILSDIKTIYSDHPVNDADGVRIDFPEGWVHLRKSNTEPIIRIYSEAETEEKAVMLADRIAGHIR
ncbi:MAG: phosphoglucosamine mutase [Marinilabiliales bacterium]|nr:MAG: phosphoglucosamine mutase [Marinilabiliales bacterium]